MLKRRSTPQPSPIEEPQEPARAGGKGRPTPKRSASQARRRGPIEKAPTDRKAAARARRDAAKAERRAKVQALATSDERNYPPLHAGKERALVRDIVDSRNSLGYIALPALAILLPLILLSTAVPALNVFVLLAQFSVIGIVARDNIINWRRIKHNLAERFPMGTKESTRTLKFYGMQRNNTRPSKRRPPPRVKPGDRI
jgi:hypothetical protein